MYGGGFKAAATSKINLFDSIVIKGYKSLPIVTKSTIFDVASQVNQKSVL